MNSSILTAPVKCPKCNWKGPLCGCEPDNDGELHCPNCQVLLVITCDDKGKTETRLGIE